MVCVPCIVVPFLLWFFHRYIRPLVIKFWPWYKEEKLENTKSSGSKNGEVTSHSNGTIPTAQEVTAGGGTPDKKND